MFDQVVGFEKAFSDDQIVSRSLVSTSGYRTKFFRELSFPLDTSAFHACKPLRMHKVVRKSQSPNEKEFGTKYLDKSNSQVEKTI